MLNLGTQTGSLINHIQSRYAQTLPQVGDAATILSWTDRDPATVVEVFKHGKFDYIVVQMDDYERVDSNGYSEDQTYMYMRNPNGPRYTYRLKNESWESVRLNENGRYVKSYGGLIVGHREKYWDPSF
jgi:hypothetical protein